MRFCFVSTRKGSPFMTELLAAVSSAIADCGHVAELAFDRFPPLREDCVYVVIPHEFHAWGDPAGFPDPRQRARTIALCTENPGTEWFDATYRLVGEFGRAVSINRSSAAELRRRGIKCEHLQLGYVPQWDTWLGDPRAERDIDVLYLGAADRRRDPLMARLGGGLWARRCQFLIPPLEPRTRPRPDFLKGEAKYLRLRSSRTLLNLHRTRSSALEWMRFLEAICNGCVVVSEPCQDNEPLIPGEHFLAADAGRIVDAIEGLLDNPERLAWMRAHAYDFVRRELPMSLAAEKLVEFAAGLPRPVPASGDSSFVAPEDTPSAARLASPSDASRDASFPGRDRRSRGLLRSIVTRVPPRRRDFGIRGLAETPSYAQSSPRVSVVSAPQRERGRIDALVSVARSHGVEFELLILGEADGSQTLELAQFLNEHAALAAKQLAWPEEHGLAHARNALVNIARGEYVFMLDACGGIYPSTLERLATPLEADATASFSYPMVAVGSDETRSMKLLGSLPWEPQRLSSGSWIDGMALIRRSFLLKLGGYCTDERLGGWEDFNLWCRCAAAGARGVHVPQVLAWRESVVNVDTPEKWALMRELFPELLAGPKEG
jgi:hypothetical protein